MNTCNALTVVELGGGVEAGVAGGQGLELHGGCAGKAR